MEIPRRRRVSESRTGRQGRKAASTTHVFAGDNLRIFGSQKDALGQMPSRKKDRTISTLCVSNPSLRRTRSYRIPFPFYSSFTGTCLGSSSRSFSRTSWFSDDASPFSHVDVADDERPFRRAKPQDGVFQGQLRDETNRAAICRWKEEHKDEQGTSGGAVGAEPERW